MRNGLQKLLRRLQVIRINPYKAILSRDVGKRLHCQPPLPAATTSTTATEPIAHENQTSPRLSKPGCGSSVEAEIEGRGAGACAERHGEGGPDSGQFHCPKLAVKSVPPTMVARQRPEAQPSAHD